MFAFFPYLKTSEPVRFRSVTIRSTDDATGLPAEVSSGSLVARQVGLESMLLTNRQRLERVCKVLSSTDTADNRLRAVAKDVSDINHYQFVGEPGLTVEHLLGSVKLLARCYLEANPSESQITAELKAVAESSTSETFEALHRLRTLDEKIASTSWTSGAVPADPRITLSTLVHSSWHYTFMNYFYLERTAK